MFQFLFKRSAGKSGQPQPGPTAPQAPAAPAAPSAREVQSEALRTIGDDENAAADFILQADYSELRLAAADKLHSRAALERVHAAMRNTDRRVAKLVQGRLDALRHHDTEVVRARALLEQAGALAGGAPLTPNQVADLDRRWAVIVAPELNVEFAAVRSALGARLDAQVQLQRAMIDRLGALRALASGDADAAALGVQLAQLQRDQEAALAAPEHASLPRNLVAEFASEAQRIGASLAGREQQQAALAARSAALDEWEAQSPEALDAGTLRRQWQQLPSAGVALQPRFDALLERLPKPVAAAPAAPAAQEECARTLAKGADRSFLDALDAMEAALQQGSLGSAAELDKVLKDGKAARGLRLSGAQADRLAQARAELKHLSDWARWGGNVSREELIKVVEQLPTQSLPMAELAKKVGSMRERWKALDTLSGTAPKTLWERFDAACTEAYAPAAAHFRQLADERHTNAMRGKALVEEAQAEIVRMQEGGEASWKHVAAEVQRLRQAWSHLGPLDRKDKKRLDQQFADALNVLQAPLEQQRKGEMDQREALIDAVKALDPQDRRTLDALRDIQQAWQAHARAVPLERRAEQALWQRFRAACDEVFAKRKESAQAADAERRGHEAARIAICEGLEVAAGQATPASAAAILREAAAAWQAAGKAPRAQEAKLDQRYRAAVALVQGQVDAVRRAVGAAQAGALRDRLRLCVELEQALAAPGATADIDWRVRWTALPALGIVAQRALNRRFDAAMAAREGDALMQGAYIALLETNRAPLLHDLLRQEIAAVDAGGDFLAQQIVQ